MSEWLPMLGVIKTYASGLQRLCVPRPCRVLIVDDEPSVRRFAERVLSDAGFVTSSASDGPDALKKFEYSEPFDVLLTDVVMPQMSGDELARRIRLKQPSVKVLYITGHSDRLFKEKTTLWDDEAFLEKPCTSDSLLEGISLLVSGHLVQKTVWTKPR
jgi:two-component system, cell cycle sensor histidine kinase and response regulator CckA